MTDDCHILLALPHRGQLYAAQAFAALLEPTENGTKVSPCESKASLLAYNFNTLWAYALTEGFTHFAMLHDDVVPEKCWLDMLLGELEKHSADVVSAVIPIKDTRGITSTAVCRFGEWWQPVRRLTMSEVMLLPETFDEVIGMENDCFLGINTGCWVADLRNDKWHEQEGDGWLRYHFGMRDGVQFRDGKYHVSVQSEDWYWSELLAKGGMRYYATRKVRLNHCGDFAFGNTTAWGTLEKDGIPK